ncbi:ABC transporter ATP-binding protein [Tannockella kyphosi]|uniref:ABC transporter ATP-binding protein n=1 Tax=Tannockella kyphosi TaxID=2899121 RepID=UPI0020118DF9|nr:ABC transporter ATP-binding protein [Tannockella kyphosi]
MIPYLRKTFALSEKGAKDLIKASFWATVVNMLIFGLTGVVYYFLQDALLVTLNNETPVFHVMFYAVYGMVLVIFIFITYYISYNANYLSAYKESAAKRISLAETIRKLPLSFFGKKDLGDVTTVIMGDATELEQAFSHYIPQMVGAVISIFIAGIGLLFFQWKMALATLWVVPIAFFLCIFTRRFQNNFSQKSKDIKLSYDDKMMECIENIRDIKANNRQAMHIDVVNQKLKDFEKSSVIAELGVSLPVVSAQMILKVGVATSMLMGVSLLSSGEIDVLTFIVFMMVSTRIFEPIAGALINIAAIFHAMISVRRMQELESTKIQTGVEIFEPNGYDIVFNNVSFAYNGEDNVLKGTSFVAKQGEVTALIGPSGGGKTTAMKLAARFWDIEEGTITIGGEDISTIDPETLLKSISIVFQDVTLFDNTVMENIRIGKKGASDQEIIEASKHAKAHDFIMALPNGYETLIGENGSSLSGGERQRISIARALLKDAPIILLDEATSSLDIKNETAVQLAIANLTKDKTVLVIAHRMRTIARANKIVLLKEGKVSQMGKHDDLIKEQGDYKKMIDLQNLSTTWKL